MILACAAPTFKGMSELAVNALLERRAVLINQIKDLQTHVFHIDGALIAIGYKNPPKQRGAHMFQRGELIALVGQAERQGCKTAREVAVWLMKNRGMDPEDRDALNHMIGKVKECRKRTSQIMRASASG